MRFSLCNTRFVLEATINKIRRGPFNVWSVMQTARHTIGSLSEALVYCEVLLSLYFEQEFVLFSDSSNEAISTMRSTTLVGLIEQRCSGAPICKELVVCCHSYVVPEVHKCQSKLICQRQCAIQGIMTFWFGAIMALLLCWTLAKHYIKFLADILMQAIFEIIIFWNI